MQTFLPLASFRGSARCLDNKRLGKQRLECKQILLCLDIAVGEHTPGKKGWRNHPAVLMWRGYELALTTYAIVVCQEWRRRSFNDKLTAEFLAVYDRLRPQTARNCYPPWFFLRRLHESHRSNLLRKDFHFYSRYGWQEPIDLPYYWPARKQELTHETALTRRSSSARERGASLPL